MSALPVTVATPNRTAPRPALHLVEGGAGAPRPTAATYRRRRAGVVLALLAVVALLVFGLGGAAEAELADPVGGHAVLEPGATLWDIAATHAPAGVDTRAYVAELVELNGFDGGSLAPWTVVLLPAE